jgi:hypothetical protein
MISILLDAVKLFDIKIFVLEDFVAMLIRFSFNFISIMIIVRGLYYPKTKRRDYLFTFIMIGISVFLLCFLLESVKLQLGFALGLFAVFGIIRYRTTTIQIREMTYLFVVISLSVINALANKKISYAELLFANVIVIVINYIIARMKILETESFTTIVYEKIELVDPRKKEELKADLEERLGVKISRIEVLDYNYMRDTAKITVYFYKSEQTWAKDKEIDFRVASDE